MISLFLSRHPVWKVIIVSQYRGLAHVSTWLLLLLSRLLQEFICLSIYLFFVFTWKLNSRKDGIMLKIILEWTMYLGARGGREGVTVKYVVCESFILKTLIPIWYFHLLTCASTCKWKSVVNARKKAFILVNLPSLRVISVKRAKI